jgi:hypothetical protein
MGKIDDPLADPSVRQQFTGKDEERDRDQQERLDTADVGQKNRLERITESLDPDDADRSDQERKKERHPGERNQEEQPKDFDREHRSLAISVGARNAADNLDEIMENENEGCSRADR